MSATTKALQTDVSGIKPQPQYYNPVSDAYETSQGTSGAPYVQVTQPLPTGTNTIGNVGVTSLPAIPAGTNAIGTVGVTSLPSLPTGSNTIGNVNSTNSGSAVTDVTLQDTASGTGNGSFFTVGGYKTITVEVTGTSTSRTINFEGASVSGVYYPVMGVKLADLSAAASTTGIAEVWQFDVTGLVNFRARIAAVAGGTVSVKGKAVA